MTDLRWLGGAVDERALQRSMRDAETRLIYDAFGRSGPEVDEDAFSWSRNILDLLVSGAIDDPTTLSVSRDLFGDAFRLSRAVVDGKDIDLRDRIAFLRTMCLGWLADQGPIAAKLIVDSSISSPGSEWADWRTLVWHRLIDVWLLLFRKRTWGDIELLKEVLTELRTAQAQYEDEYLAQADRPATAAWELVALYHLSKAADVLCDFLTRGESGQRFDVRQQIDSHFDRAIAAAGRCDNLELPDLTLLLNSAAVQMIENSIWSIARAAGPGVRRFVESLTSQEHPILEVLAPQREALGTSGLARAAQRSVVVSLPTSSGKTLIAEFRIIQALSLFREARGFVVYLAPTRALVNQIARRLRRDLGALEVNVEKVSPALEVDGVEAELLADADPGTQFDVLVTTPEKLDLLIRGGWVAETGRPMSLLVVDEAHNLAQSARGLRIELLLATVNRELRDSQFLLLTPFIDNAAHIANWLDPASSQSVQLEVHWQPNDRIVALGRRLPGDKRGDCYLSLESLATTRETLSMDEQVVFPKNRPLGLTFSAAAGQNRWAAAISAALSDRGSTITLVQQPRYAWGVAQDLAAPRQRPATASDSMRAIQQVLDRELGKEFPLQGLLAAGVGVHHSGLPDDVRYLTEWLLETGGIEHLVATTTVAQGVNFPVANVVFATHQYPYGELMPASDFWNIAGRAGRVDQGQVGVIAMASPTEDRDATLRGFVNSSVESLNSTLVSMVKGVIAEFGSVDLRRLSVREEWSPFVQYLSHSYRQIGDHARFVAEVEQVLRGTLGFQSLRAEAPRLAAALVHGVHDYAEGLFGKQLGLVDSTGFSWETVAATLGRLADAQIGQSTWSAPIFSDDREPLARMIGVMLEVPELRGNLVEGAADATDQGRYLANVIHDWVNGSSLEELAGKYFSRSKRTAVDAMSVCCQRLFGKIAPTVSWGLSAIQAMTLRGDAVAPEVQRSLRNLPGYAYYGVDNEAAIGLRLLNVPRTAAVELSRSRLFEVESDGGRIGSVRRQLRDSTSAEWRSALGMDGDAYFKVWRILDGSD